MVEELRLWAINVDTFRQCFAAPEPLAGHLRELAAPVLCPDQPRRTHSLLSRLGPLTRQPVDGGVIRPGAPNHHDLESLLAGRFIDSSRAEACWALVRAWLDGLADARTTIALASDRIDAIEFDLVRAEVPIELSVRHLWQKRLDIPLRSSEHMSIGFTAAHRLTELHHTWASALPALAEETADFVNPTLTFIAALIVDPPPTPAGPPDLLAWWTSR
ncbi:MAG: hypothetical protein LBV00_03675 [Propionibacteriaceae bacterium]|jgi:hypothetical protein|nr:hypothetical protein [Propionibacteriaceae bacterium]